MPYNEREDMIMKKENIALLTFPLLWCFWFFWMQGHIAFGEESDFFMLKSAYWQGFSLKPGGWTEYLANFLLQFYKWPVIGALLLTGVNWGLYLAIRFTAVRLSVPSVWLWVGYVPVFLHLYLQLHSGLLLGESLRIVLFFWALGGYLAISSAKWRYGIFTLFFPLFYLILSPGGCIFLYLTCWGYDLWRMKGKGRWGIGILWLGLLWSFPYFWRQDMFFCSSKSLYALTSASLEETGIWAVRGMYVYGLLLLLIAYMAGKIQRAFRRWVYWGELALVFIGLGLFLYRMYPAEQEYFYRLDQAVQQGEWELALQVAQKIKEPTREEMYLICLALACNDQLGDRLFDFPVWGLGCLYLPRDMDYKTSVIGGEFYYRLNIPNEGIHWIFQASVSTPQGMNFRCLRRLVDLNIRKRDFAVAEKYLSVLERSLTHRQWCADKRRELETVSRDTLNVFADRDFFIGGRPFLSDMARVLDAGKSKSLTLNYVLCGLLLDKELEKFYRIFTHFYSCGPDIRLPKIYEQALLVTMDFQHGSGMGECTISPESRKAYLEYMTIFQRYQGNKEEAKKMLWRFKNTYWYYLHFTSPRIADVKGHELPGVRYST